MSIRPRSARPVLLLIALLALIGACSSDSGTKTTSSGSGAGASNTAAEKVTLGYFPNVTHSPAIVAVEKGFFTNALGSTKLDTKTFNAGPEATEALLSGAIDATFIGPNPSINAFQKSNGEAIRIVAGSTSGGASLVVAKDINSAQDLKGKSVASPQLGNTQDVALRSWLKDQGLSADTSGGGDVSIKPQDNSATLDQFKQGQIAGAWVPEPWATRLVQEGDGKVLVDEKTLWPGGRFVTTNLIVSTSFLNEHPDTVKALIQGESDAIKFIASNNAEAQTVVNNAIKNISGKALPDAVISASFGNMDFTLDPIATSLQTSAEHAKDVGLLDSTDLKGIYDLSALNAVLSAAGQPPAQGL